MKHVIQHHLDVPTAKKVTDRAFAEYKARYGQYKPEMQWATDNRADIRFHAMGMTLKGDMEVAPGEISMDLDVPFLLRPFRKAAMEVIDREVRVWLGKADAGEI